MHVSCVTEGTKALCMMDVMLLRQDVTMTVMKSLCVTKCDACIMCDRCGKGIMYDECNIIMTICDNSCDVTIMCDAV